MGCARATNKCWKTLRLAYARNMYAQTRSNACSHSVPTRSKAAPVCCLSKEVVSMWLRLNSVWCCCRAHLLYSFPRTVPFLATPFFVTCFLVVRVQPINNRLDMSHASSSSSSSTNSSSMRQRRNCIPLLQSHTVSANSFATLLLAFH